MKVEESVKKVKKVVEVEVEVPHKVLFISQKDLLDWLEEKVDIEAARDFAHCVLQEGSQNQFESLGPKLWIDMLFRWCLSYNGVHFWSQVSILWAKYIDSKCAELEANDVVGYIAEQSCL